MRNRYGDNYHFEQINENTYVLRGDLKYWRYGGQEGQDRIDYNDLGFVDPSGGPFISAGYEIERRKVVRISVVGEDIQLQVE